MKHRYVLALAAATAGLVLVLVSLTPSMRARQATATDPAFTLPPGFEVRRVAGPPLVNRPIVADFDEEGRLYVADSSGSNDKVEKQLADKPHRIVRLEDKDGDGVFESGTVFADRMMFPEGTMWFDGSLYVAAPPSIWKLTDTDGDGVADRREEWFQGKTLTGCANDLHGPYLGLDGWIYWTKGAFAEQTYERPGRKPLVTKAAHIFRRHPQGAFVEPVMNGGMDNPVDVAFTPTGERILTATFLEHPQLGRRDALIHAVYGGLYGKPHAVIEGHKRTGELMPELSQLGPAAPSGLTRYASRVFGDEYRDNFFATMFNLRKVTRHVLEPSGGTFKSTDSDFLVSDSLDFHPTDVVEDADGSLLVVDTGAWYKLCCPTSQLAKPEVLGSIYRVTRKGARKVEDPRGRTIAWPGLDASALTKWLDDPRPAVQARAIHHLSRSRAAVPVLADTLTARRSAEARRNAVWALTRIDAPEARGAVRSALEDRDPSVRHAAIHSIAVWRDAAALQPLLTLVESSDPALQRVAAEALGRIGDARAIPILLRAAGAAEDRALEHSLTYAVIEINNPSATASALQASSSRSRRAALIALDQMDDRTLTAATIVPLLESPDRVLQETAWWIAGHHPDWGGALAGHFEKRLGDARPGSAAADDLQQKLAQFATSPQIEQLIADTVTNASSAQATLTALGAMTKARMKELPQSWAPAIAAALRANDVEATKLAIAAGRSAPPRSEDRAELSRLFVGVARDPSVDAAVRLDALAAVHGGLASVDPVVFDLLRTSLDPSRPAAIRVAAAGVLEKARLDAAQLRALLASLERAGPLELSRLLPPFDHANDETLGLDMVATLERSKGRSSLRPDVLRPRLEKHPPSVRARGEALLASLNQDSAKQARRLEELIGTLPAGDIRRGQAVFNSPKAACLSCHALGYVGGRIGPDLTRIGQIRSERDLLEAIVFPSASFARGYESVLVTTASGAIVGGVLRGDLRDEMVIATGERDETRIRREDVEDVQPGTVSVMPAGLDQQLTAQELADLLAFLKATRPGAS